MGTSFHGVHLGIGAMNPLDWVIALTLAVSTIGAFMTGLIRSVFALAGLLVGVLVASLYARPAAVWLSRWIQSFPLAEVAGFLLLLAAVYLVAALLGRLLRGACSAAGLGFFDRLAGACFGFARGVLLLAATLLPLGPYLQHFGPARDSALLPYLLPAAHGISFVLPRAFDGHFSTGTWLHDAGAIAGDLTPAEGRTTPTDRGDTQ